MNEAELRAGLAEIALGGLRYFASIGSTNDEGQKWSEHNAPDLSLVVADEQTAGRGRSGRKWFTPAGSALAFSLILRPTPPERSQPAHITALGALAIAEALQSLGLETQIKWPNDVLIHGRKVAGILVESRWSAGRPESFVLGMGLNVKTESIPPPTEIQFAATCVEQELGKPIDRYQLLREILRRLIRWRPKVGNPEFLEAWETALAYLGKEVFITEAQGAPQAGKLLGLESDGSLRLQSDNKILTIHFGDIHLRPSNDNIS